MRRIIFVFCLFFIYNFSFSLNSAKINGVIKDSTGNNISNANIVLKHLPTNISYKTNSQTNGNFSFNSIKPGKDYIIEISKIGYANLLQQNFIISISDELFFSFVLTEKPVILNDIIINSTHLSNINTKFGESSVIESSRIKNLPTITRSFHDYTKLSPLVASNDGSLIGGRNARYNNILVDGAGMNDVFGVPNSGTPNAAAETQPISLEIIDEFQVTSTPFDVKYGGFTGGLINAVTKYGVNEFKGNIYGFYTDQNFVGKSPDTKRASYANFNDYTYGASISGPIIKNKLFYFVNAESRQKSTPKSLNFNNSAASVNFPTPYSDILRIDSISKNIYNFNPGSIDSNYSAKIEDIKLFARIDYNINENNRLILRHNFINGGKNAGISRTARVFDFTSQEYEINSIQNQTVLQLNSIISNDFFSETKVAYTNLIDDRIPNASKFPYIKILNFGSDKNSFVLLGNENNSQLNRLNQSNLEISEDLTYNFNNHIISAGANLQYMNFDYLLIPNYYGYYEFQSIDDFAKGRWSRYQNTYSLLPNNELPAAKWSLLQPSFYISDEWIINVNFKLNYGIRGDWYLIQNSPHKNSTFDSIYSSMNLATENIPTNLFNFSPRIGFNYKPDFDKSLQIRAGIGIFAGRIPAVWFANQFSNSGNLLASVDTRDTINNKFLFEKNPENQPRLAGKPSSAIAITDPNFKMPSTAKFNLGFDKELPFGFNINVDLIYQKTINDITFKNVNLVDSNEFGADGRFLFKKAQLSNLYSSVIMMTNSSEGDQKILSLQLQKQFNKGILPYLYFNFSYSKMLSRDVNSTMGSDAMGNWAYFQTKNPNNAYLSTSIFDIPNRFLIDLAYQYEYCNGYSTSIGLIYEGKSNQPFTFIYNYAADPNNDGIYGNDIAFIPKNENDIILNTKDSKGNIDPTKGNWNELLSFLNEFDGIEEQKGKIMDRNSLRAPFLNFLDMRITQKIPTYSNQNLELSLDILNLLNLLNQDLGFIKFVSFQSYQLFQFEGYILDPSDNKMKPKVSFYKPVTKDINGNTSIFRVNDYLSRWRMQFSLKYNF